MFRQAYLQEVVIVLAVSRSLVILAMDFPQRLAALRKARGLTQQALADLVQLHVTQINRYESGDSQPTLEVIRRLVIALSVSADDLIFDKNERGPDEDLKLQFEAVSHFDEEDKQLARGILEGLILKHQAKQSMLRQSAAKKRNDASA
jgi:transcriptional regulator with XRE-family HTH domain